MNESVTEKQFYLFEFGNIVMDDGITWYRRDRQKHKWIEQPGWITLFFDPANSVIEIKYDEQEEKNISRRLIPGFSGGEHRRLCEPQGSLLCTSLYSATVTWR